MAVKSRSGAGVLDKVDYVVRISTEGGVPADGAAGERARNRKSQLSSHLFISAEGGLTSFPSLNRRLQSSTV